MRKKRFSTKTNRESISELLSFYQTNFRDEQHVKWENEYLMWVTIFVNHFSEFPSDPKLQPSNYALGSTDPRWDDLLHEKEMLRAQAIVIRYLQLHKDLKRIRMPKVEAA